MEGVGRKTDVKRKFREEGAHTGGPGPPHAQDEDFHWLSPPPESREARDIFYIDHSPRSERSSKTHRNRRGAKRLERAATVRKIFEKIAGNEQEDSSRCT